MYNAGRDEKVAKQRYNYLSKFSGCFQLNFFFLFKILIGIRQYFELMDLKIDQKILLQYSEKMQSLKLLPTVFHPEFLQFLSIVDISQIWSINERF